MAKKGKRQSPRCSTCGRAVSQGVTTCARCRRAAGNHRYWNDVHAIARETGRSIASARKLAGLVRRDADGELIPRAAQVKAASRIIRETTKANQKYAKKTAAAAKAKRPKKARKKAGPRRKVGELAAPLNAAELEEEQLEELAETGEVSAPSSLESLQNLLHLKDLFARETKQGNDIYVETPVGKVDAFGGDEKNGLAAHAELWRLMEPYAKAMKTPDKYWFLQGWWAVEFGDGVLNVTYKGPTNG